MDKRKYLNDEEKLTGKLERKLESREVVEIIINTSAT